MMHFRACFVFAILSGCFAVAGRCDLLSVSGGNTISPGVYENLTFRNLNGMNTSSITGAPSASTAFGFNLGPLTIPMGSALNSAVLDLALTAGAPPLYISRSETDYAYQYQVGMQYICTYYYFGSCVSGYWVPVYRTAYGHGGYAGFNTEITRRFLYITDGSSYFNLPAAGGTVDLLGAGFGPSLLAGNSLTILADTQVNLLSTILDWGYYAETQYSASSYGQVSAAGTLIADFTPPQPDAPPTSVPEPESVVLLATAAGGAAMVLRKRSLRLR